MNLDLVFKSLFVLECLLAILALIAALKGNRRNWRSTVAGVFVLSVALGINGLHFHRTGQAQDLVLLVMMMAVGIGFLFAADAD